MAIRVYKFQRKYNIIILNLIFKNIYIYSHQLDVVLRHSCFACGTMYVVEENETNESNPTSFLGNSNLFSCSILMCDLRTTCTFWPVISFRHIFLYF